MKVVTVATVQTTFFAYKKIHVFGLADVNTEDIFTVCASNSRRGYNCTCHI